MFFISFSFRFGFVKLNKLAKCFESLPRYGQTETQLTKEITWMDKRISLTERRREEDEDIDGSDGRRNIFISSFMPFGLSNWAVFIRQSPNGTLNGPFVWPLLETAVNLCAFRTVQFVIMSRCTNSRLKNWKGIRAVLWDCDIWLNSIFLSCCRQLIKHSIPILNPQVWS